MFSPLNVITDNTGSILVNKLSALFSFISPCLGQLPICYCACAPVVPGDIYVDHNIFSKGQSCEACNPTFCAQNQTMCELNKTSTKTVCGEDDPWWDGTWAKPPKDVETCDKETCCCPISMTLNATNPLVSTYVITLEGKACTQKTVHGSTSTVFQGQVVIEGHMWYLAKTDAVIHFLPSTTELAASKCNPSPFYCDFGECDRGMAPWLVGLLAGIGAVAAVALIAIAVYLYRRNKGYQKIQ